MWGCGGSEAAPTTPLSLFSRARRSPEMICCTSPKRSTLDTGSTWDIIYVVSENMARQGSLWGHSFAASEVRKHRLARTISPG